MESGEGGWGGGGLTSSQMGSETGELPLLYSRRQLVLGDQPILRSKAYICLCQSSSTMTNQDEQEASQLTSSTRS